MIPSRPNLGQRPGAAERPAITRAEIAVPVPGSAAERMIDPGSGIVLLPFEADPSKALAYYEGNRFGAVNLGRWTERVHIAFSRASTRYPTVARSLIPREELEVVGHFENNRFWMDKPDAAGRWLGVSGFEVQRLIMDWDMEAAAKQASRDFRSGRGFGRNGRP